MTVDTNAADIPFLDLKSEAYKKDPFIVLNEARERHWLARTETGFEILRYGPCAALMPDPNFIPGIQKIIADMGLAPDQLSPFPGGRNMLLSEGETHTALRQAAAPWFSMRTVEGLRAQTHALIDAVVARVEPSGACDFQNDIAAHIPPAVFCSMIGADVSNAPHIYAWSSALGKLFNADPDDLPEIMTAMGELGAFVTDLIAEKKKRPGDDLTSYVLQSAQEGHITEADVGSLLTEIMAASSDNTSITASLMVWNLATQADQWVRLKQNADLIPSAVEETMRLYPRVLRASKVAIESHSHDSVTFPAESHVYFNIAAANRDPRVFDNADQFLVGRDKTKPQLVFGLGRHHCLGAVLARMEVSEILRVLLARWTSIGLAGDAIFLYTDDMQVVALPLTFQIK